MNISLKKDNFQDTSNFHCIWKGNFKNTCKSQKNHFDRIHNMNRTYSIRNANNILPCKVKYGSFKRLFPSVIIERNKLDPKTQNAVNLNTFKKNRVKFTRPSANFIFSCHNLKKIKYLKILRYKLSHLDEHKFKNNFQDTLNTLCKYACDIENIRCHRFSLKESLVSTKLLKLIKSIRGDYSQGTSNWQLRYTIKVTL